jgi:hypothetical protein
VHSVCHNMREGRIRGLGVGREGGRGLFSVSHAAAQTHDKRATHQAHPRAVQVGIDRHNDVVNSVRDGVFPFQIDPRRVVAEGIRELSDLWRVERCREEADLRRETDLHKPLQRRQSREEIRPALGLRDLCSGLRPLV